MKIENTVNKINFGGEFCLPSRRLGRKIKNVRDNNGKKFDYKRFIEDIPNIKSLSDDSITFSLDLKNMAKKGRGTPYSPKEWPVLVATKNLNSSKKVSTYIFLFDLNNVNVAKELIARIKEKVLVSLEVQNVIRQITEGMRQI